MNRPKGTTHTRQYDEDTLIYLKVTDVCYVWEDEVPDQEPRWVATEIDAEFIRQRPYKYMAVH